MGKKYVIDEKTLIDIADRLRKTLDEKQMTYKPEDMWQRINDVYAEGYREGHTDGYNEGHTAGKQAENKAFWDDYLPILNDGTMNQTQYLFAGNGWNDNTFYPDRNLFFVGYNPSIFQSNRCTNLRKRFEELGITIGGADGYHVLTSVQSFFRGLSSTELPDLTYFKPTNLQYFCEASKNLKWIPYYDTSECTNMYHAFANCSSLERIEGIDFSSVTSTTNTFSGCTALTTVIVYGVIPISLSFSASPLSVESMKSIIVHLKDYSGTESAGAYTLTLKDSCKTAMAEQGAIEELGGKTYDQYITDIGWNLA